MFFTVLAGERHFQITTTGSSNPTWLIESFFAETDVRARWWQPQADDVVFDVGAGYGSYTLPALANGAVVFAFEPGRHEFFDLATQVALNRFGGRCLLHNFLVGEKADTLSHYDPATRSCLLDQPEAERRIVNQIDALVERCDLKRLDWLKVDVEGVEPSVLVGAKAALRRFHPRVLLENHEGFLPGARDRVIEFFMALEPGWREERLTRPELGQNADWSLWTWQGER